jgi:hypothetical protein
MMTKPWIAGVLAVLAAAALGCASTTPDGDLVPNSPPDSRVTAVPPVLGQTNFTVHFFWTGSDLDGEVSYFEWRISNNGRDGHVDVADTSSLAWHRTAVTDSSFVVKADIDSFNVDVNDPRQGPRDYRAWDTHTFFLRAVDNDGARDPTPATVSFTATTLTPTIEINVPPAQTVTACQLSARVLTFGWLGKDPDSENLEPEFVRYLLYPTDHCWTKTQFDRENPLAQVPESAWGPWLRYDAPQDSGKTITLARQALLQNFFFAVQAQDGAGAVTPTFEWGVNVRHVQISDTQKPVLTVTEKFLGSFQFSSANGLQLFEIVSGQPLRFEWRADASQYAGVIDAYRFGWEVQDVNDPNDPGWAVGWGEGPLFRRAGPKSFSQGTPNFVVQARDNSGTIVRGIFQFDVIQIAQRQNQRDLLLVEDWPHTETQPEIARHREWKQRWDNLLVGRVSNFDPGADRLDTHVETGGFVFRRLNNYKSVIYFSSGANHNTQFHLALAPITTLLPRYNWFEVYQARVGNVLMCGPQSAFNTIEYEPVATPPQWVYPIIFNVSDGPGQDGFGQETAADGSKFNRGTLRYPYTGFCVELIDVIRPAPQQIYNEDSGIGKQLRTLNCDGIYKAVVDPQFLASYPSANGEVVDLLSGADRSCQNFINRKGDFQFEHEEFYNVNTTSRDVALNLRDCQQTMYRMRARRDEGCVAFADTNCYPKHLLKSKLDLAPIGIVSTAYALSKPLAGSEDFLWGFHPLAFDQATVRSSLLWILRERWQIPAQ